MTGLRRLTGLIVCSCLIWAAPAAADPITELNVIAADTIFAGGRPAGAAPLLDFAMVHAAIHDAVQAYEKRFQPLCRPHWRRHRLAGGRRCQSRARRPGQSVPAADRRRFDAKYLAFLTNHGLTEADEGRFVGEQAAAANHRTAGG